jgi:hypothetical protein
MIGGHCAELIPHGTAMTSDDIPLPDEAPSRSEPLSVANINPVTWLATDYLNHFNEAIMLLEMYPSFPDCLEDILAWKPKSYREHFSSSRFKDRKIALAAYDAADPTARSDLESLSDMMSVVLQATCAAMRSDMPREDAAALAQSVVSGLKPLVARAGAVINGDGKQSTAPQAAADLIFKRGA